MVLLAIVSLLFMSRVFLYDTVIIFGDNFCYLKYGVAQVLVFIDVLESTGIPKPTLSDS